MSSFGVHMSYASVDRGDGSDPRAAAREILRRLRVPAGISAGDEPWDNSSEAVVIVPVTDDAHVLTLTSDDAVDTTLPAERLREEFRTAGLTLWLHAGEETRDDDTESHEAEPDHLDGTESADLVDADEEVTTGQEAAFEVKPVQIALFSHRGPFAARIVAQLNGVDVEHIESGSWSLLRFASGEPTATDIASKAELPVIEVNRVEGGASWFEVTTKGGVHLFWPDAERGTVPVLDLDAISVVETAEICRRLLREGDGSTDELADVAAHARFDFVAAQRALQPEALGGVVGQRARIETFLAAFGIPDDLISAVWETTALDAQRFSPMRWGALLGEVLLDGTPAMTPLTHRDRPFARIVAALERRPLLAAALSVGELVVGILASRRAGLSRAVGFLFISDGIGNLVLGAMRQRR